MSATGPERLHLIMAVHCNVRCVMCYQTSFSRDLAMPGVIYQEHLKPLYSSIKLVKLQGGEPTIMRNCKEFCLLIRDYPQVKIAVTTNGIHINDFWLETLVNQGQYVNISLNAAHEQSYAKIVKHGNFAKAVGNIGRLVENNQGGQLNIAMSMVIIPANANDIYDFLKLGHGLGVGEINFGFDPLLTFHSLPPRKALHAMLDNAFAFMAENGIHSEGLDVFARRVGYQAGEAAPGQGRPRCPMPFRNLVVDEKGDVRVCCATWQTMGNTYQTSIDDILSGSRIRKFQKLISRDNYKWCDPKCPDNPHPHRLATVNKYMYAARKDPKEFASKARAKLRKLRQV